MNKAEDKSTTDTPLSPYRAHPVTVPCAVAQDACAALTHLLEYFESHAEPEEDYGLTLFQNHLRNQAREAIKGLNRGLATEREALKAKMLLERTEQPQQDMPSSPSPRSIR